MTLDCSGFALFDNYHANGITSATTASCTKVEKVSVMKRGITNLPVTSECVFFGHYIYALKIIMFGYFFK